MHQGQQDCYSILERLNAIHVLAPWDGKPAAFSEKRRRATGFRRHQQPYLDSLMILRSSPLRHQYSLRLSNKTCIDTLTKLLKQRNRTLSPICHHQLVCRSSCDWVCDYLLSGRWTFFYSSVALHVVHIRIWRHGEGVEVNI